MPRIPSEHLQAVVYMYPSQEAAEEGKRVGGSGFMVSYPSIVYGFTPAYLVTNRHAIKGECFWARWNKTGGGVSIKHIPLENWKFPEEPDDIAVTFIDLQIDGYATTLRLDKETMVLRDSVSALDVGPGDEAYMCGRFMAHGGKVSNNPIARFGHISLMPDENEKVERPQGDPVAAYLLEMHSHPGFTGSPVFLYIPADSVRIGEIDTAGVEHFRLLGIDTGNLGEYLPVGRALSGEPFQPHPSGSVVISNRGIAVVCPIWKVVDLLEREDFIAHRRQLEKRYDSNSVMVTD